MDKSQKQLSFSLRVATIDIEGILGVPEVEQFDSPEGHIATYERFVEALGEIRQEGEIDRLVVNIRSTGGCLADALLIYEAIAELDAEVVTRCYGYVASAATIIAQAASKGCREISANALYLIHCCESTVEGNTHSLSATKELLDKSDGRLAEIYSLASGRDADHFRELMNRNNGKGVWLTPQETIEASLADTIIAAAPITDDAREQIVALGLTPLPTTASARKSSAWSKLLALVGRTKAESHEPLAEVAVSPSRADAPMAAAPPVPPSRLYTAAPTRVKECEDPLPTGLTALTSNQSAYMSDVERVREALMR